MPSRSMASPSVLTPLAAGVAVFAALAVPSSPLEAQQGWPDQRAAWLGLSYDIQWVQHDQTCQPRVLVDAVVHGAPAARAGLRPGDRIVEMDGRPLADGRLLYRSAPLAAGDSVRLRVARGESVRELVAVADERPSRPPMVLMSRDAPTDAPVVSVSGDSLVARNLDVGSFWPPRGYWLTHEDGRREFRRLDQFDRLSQGPLDRRVDELLRCAMDARMAVPEPPAPGGAEDLQRRADSLRYAMTRRIMAARVPDALPDAGEVRIQNVPRPQDAPAAPGAPGGTLTVRSGVPGAAPVQVYTYRFSDHVTAAERGVAGAEVTGLEPQLAEYFSGVDDGVLVLRVTPGTPAHRAGLRPGDVITEADGRAIESVDHLRAVFAPGNGTALDLRVIRHGRGRTLTIPRP